MSFFSGTGKNILYLSNFFFGKLEIFSKFFGKSKGLPCYKLMNRGQYVVDVCKFFVCHPWLKCTTYHTVWNYLKRSHSFIFVSVQGLETETGNRPTNPYFKGPKLTEDQKNTNLPINNCTQCTWKSFRLSNMLSPLKMAAMTLYHVCNS